MEYEWPANRGIPEEAEEGHKNRVWIRTRVRYV